MVLLFNILIIVCAWFNIFYAKPRVRNRPKKNIIHSVYKNDFKNYYGSGVLQNLLQEHCAQKIQKKIVSQNAYLQFDIYHIWHKPALKIRQEQKDAENGVSKAIDLDSQELTSNAFNVRVLLGTHQYDGDPIIITSNKDFIITIYDPFKKMVYKKSQISITASKNAFYINDKIITASIIKIDAGNGYIIFDGKQYQGSFLLVSNQDHWFLINQLGLEDYTCSVLRSESWPGWPLEVNKAFAIAIRSYLAATVLEAKALGRPYHIRNTNIHQTYNGFHTNERLKLAIDQTKGLVVAYNKKPILAMFDCCCGGIIPAHMQGIDFIKAPYLARKIPCTFCKKCKIYQWKLELSEQDFEEIMQEGGKSLKHLREIKVTKKDKAGVVHQVVVKGKQGSHVVTGKQFYSLVSKIKSYCYNVEKKSKKIIISGRGYGHHLGICQWGARRMVDEGWNYRRILHFYYPGTIIMKLRIV